ncbi:MAG: nucleoside 2-deoxyribosyltransferase domain-containing protein [Chloroflexi bacterium]|nr:nucleoside 2-deoxyribosyltransferase domain-containing protein [Chloroflexota bacterium]
MCIYFAAPLFSQAERRFNEHLTQRLEAQGFTVFLPQRDGAEKDPPARISEERGQAIFHLDKGQIFASDIFLFILDGRVPDEGACVELGLAYCQRELQGTKKLLIGLLTDSRSSQLNPMLRVPLDYLASNEETLLQILQQYQTTGIVPSQEKS